MGKYIKYYDAHFEYDGEKDLLDLPNVSWCEYEEDVHYIPEDYYYNQYLTFNIIKGGTLNFENLGVGDSLSCTIYYSLNSGITWEVFNYALTVTLGQKILFKGNNSTYSLQNDSTHTTRYYSFSGTASFDVSGNIMSLIGGDNFKNTTTFGTYAFRNLFKGSKIVNAINLILPVTTLTNYCYTSMFENCTSLITSPKLSATLLARGCYSDTFYGCTSLITAPELPATTLAENCYYSMFNNCTSLTIAPKLPAITLVNNCYIQMFKNCSSLNYIKAMFTTTPNSNYTYNWVNNVASSGTFVKNSAAQWTDTSVNGIPTGWTVQTASA